MNNLIKRASSVAFLVMFSLCIGFSATGEGGSNAANPGYKKATLFKDAMGNVVRIDCRKKGTNCRGTVGQTAPAPEEGGTP